MLLQALMFTPYIVIASSIALAGTVALICYSQPTHRSVISGFGRDNRKKTHPTGGLSRGLSRGRCRRTSAHPSDRSWPLAADTPTALTN